MTPQEVFDTVAAHLRQQHAKSEISPQQAEELNIDRELYSGKIACAYRGAEGKKCAAGILIQDFEYSPQMEGKNFRAVLLDSACPPSLHQRLSGNGLLISRLQTIHDVYPVSEWEQQLKWMAENYRLVYTPLTP